MSNPHSGPGTPYEPLTGANVPRDSAWLEGQKAGSRRMKWIIGGIILLVVVAAVGGGVGGYEASKHRHASTSSSNNGATTSSGGNSSGSSTSTATPPPSDANDPSKFTRNPEFHKIFTGMAYTPVGSILPNCTVTQDEVIADIQLMSQLTDTIRVYGASCNVSALVLNAIKLTKTDIKVYLGNFIVVGDPDGFTRQKTAIEDALKTYGADHVLGVTVGNEVMLNACVDAHITDPNSPAVAAASDFIVSSIQTTRSSLQALGFPNLKVGNSDAGSYFSTAVLQVSDFGLANVHPWFAHQPVATSANWTWDFFKENNVDFAATLSNKPEMFIAEVGWPTGTNPTTPEAGNNGAATGGDASIANLQIFLDTFVCQSNQMGVKYFYFELFDELWKDPIYKGVESHWGLLDSDKKLKPGLTLPTCVISGSS